MINSEVCSGLWFKPLKLFAVNIVGENIKLLPKLNLYNFNNLRSVFLGQVPEFF